MNKKTALVTGGARGIGKAIVQRLADDGYRVVLNYRTSKKEALGVAAELKRKRQECILLQADISKEGEVERMMRSVAKRFGSLDVLVNNAAIIDTEPLHDLTPRHLDRILGTNLRGTILVTKHALPLLEKATGKKIVFIISSSAFVGSNTQFAYAVSKAGLVGAVRALALEGAPKGILVNGVAPGYVNTEMIRTVKAQMDVGVKKIPMGRIAEPYEVAALVSFLVSPDNTYITGQCIHINGGRYMS